MISFVILQWGGGVAACLRKTIYIYSFVLFQGERVDPHMLMFLNLRLFCFILFVGLGRGLSVRYTKTYIQQ